MFTHYIHFSHKKVLKILPQPLLKLFTYLIACFDIFMYKNSRLRSRSFRKGRIRHDRSFRMHKDWLPGGSPPSCRAPRPWGRAGRRAGPASRGRRVTSPRVRPPASSGPRPSSCQGRRGRRPASKQGSRDL
jgi:hypothetical protein